MQYLHEKNAEAEGKGWGWESKGKVSHNYVPLVVRQTRSSNLMVLLIFCLHQYFKILEALIFKQRAKY